MEIKNRKWLKDTGKQLEKETFLEFKEFYLTAMRYWLKEKTRMENTKEKEVEIKEQIDKLDGMWKTVEEWYKSKSENK